MPKSGKARVPTPEEWSYLFSVIQKKRYPVKNTAIMQISHKLGLRAQEISLLQFKEVCKLAPYAKNTPRDFTLYEILSLPAAYTKGADALNRSKAKYERKTLSFKKEDFDKAVKQIINLAQAGAEINPEDFYPPPRKHKGKSRDLPMVDLDLRESLEAHIIERLEKHPALKPSDPLFITQKGGAYSPNTLQEHMGMMLKEWASIEKASSHSGRRALLTHLIHTLKLPISVAQEIAGHLQPSTTVIYTQPTEQEITEALKKVGYSQKAP